MQILTNLLVIQLFWMKKIRPALQGYVSSSLEISPVYLKFHRTNQIAVFKLLNNFYGH